MKANSTPRTNNRFLLDTHIFIWLIEGNKRLPKELIESLKDPNITLFLSIASIWEIAIKSVAKKLRVPRNLEVVIKEAGITVLPIELPHVFATAKLALKHKDPFDRMLVAQAQIEKLTIITVDEKIKKYDVRVFKL